jgi:uncharacterized membrane protein YdjX (TVP38/TMEM64 family)
VTAPGPRGLTRLNPRVILRGLILIGSLVAFGYLLQATQFGTAINEAWIDNEIRGKGMDGELLFLAAGALFMAVGLPRQLISFLGGYAFGFVLGGTLALLSSVAGCVATFYYARLMGRGVVKTRFSKRIKKFDDFLHHNPFSMTLLIRLLPAGSNLATNLIAGVSSVPGLAFFAGSALGYLPQTAVFALVGSGINLDPMLRISVGALMFVVSGVLGVWLYRKYRHGKTLGAELERELTDPPARGQHL